MLYECARKNDFLTNKEIVNIPDKMEWKPIDSVLVENMIDVAKILNDTFGSYNPKARAEELRKELAEGNIIMLTNFYVRKKQAC